jgi:hypothetical protein
MNLDFLASALGVQSNFFDNDMLKQSQQGESSNGAAIMHWPHLTSKQDPALARGPITV